MSYILCGSKKYNNINFNNLIDDNFINIIRFNMNIPINNCIYGTRDSIYQILNVHVFENFNTKDLSSLLKIYNKNDPEQVKSFYFYKIKKTSVKFIRLSSMDNNTYKINTLLKKISSNYLFRNGKIARCGIGAISEMVDNNIKPHLIGYSIYDDDADGSFYFKENKISDCHDPVIEKKMIINFHNNNLVDATLCCLKDNPIPTLDCKFLIPSETSIIYILKTYGICILKNYYSNEIIDKLTNKFHKIFNKNKNKIEILDKEDCSNDERIFHAEKYSTTLKKIWSDNEFFNNIALTYTNHRLNKKTLINKVVYEEGLIKNSGAGWHRDNHDCQFKVLMYLSDVNEKNGPFQFITNSSKKYIGYPKPRTENYNTRFHDKTIEDLMEKNENCNKHDVIGEKGTIIIVDTTYIHRGKIIEEGERYAITEYFI